MNCIVKSILPFLLIQLLSAPRSASAAEREDLRSISTNGEAVLFVAPNQVTVTLGVQSFNAELSKAKATNDTACLNLLGVFKRLEIEDKYIQTSQINIEVRYRESQWSKGIDGYSATQIYAIKLNDLSKLDALIDESMTGGANMLLDVQFDNTDLRKHRDDARKMAIRAAKEKAQMLAGELEMKVGKPRSINEGYSGMVNRRSNFNFSSNSSVTPFVGVGEETVSLGQIEVRANVSVAFDLE